MGRATLKDVASAANVSTTTVSHALNGTRYVRPATRERIQMVAAELAYRPDPIARALQGQDTLLVGYITSNLVTNAFYAQVARGADRRAQELGFAMVLASVDDNAEAERKAVHLLLEKRVGGIIFNPPKAVENVTLAVNAGIAAVMIERPWPVVGAHAVITDHHRALYSLTTLLLEQGHHQIAFIGGDIAQAGGAIVERPRLRGFQDALKDAHLRPPAAHIVLVPYGIDTARAACRRVLDTSPQPSALVVGSDLLAAGVLQVLYERRLRIPDDISVVSFDDTLGPYLAPPLTEAEPAVEEMGRAAVELIATQRRQPDDQPLRPRRVVLQARLHLRASTHAVPLSGTDTLPHQPDTAPAGPDPALTVRS